MVKTHLPMQETRDAGSILGFEAKALLEWLGRRSGGDWSQCWKASRSEGHPGLTMATGHCPEVTGYAGASDFG